MSVLKSLYTCHLNEAVNVNITTDHLKSIIPLENMMLWHIKSVTLLSIEGFAKDFTVV